MRKPLRRFPGRATLEREIRAWATRLRRRFPTRRPLIVRVGLPPHDYLGWCESTRDGHIVTIHRDFPGCLSLAVETLCHEYAHAIVFDRGLRGDDHSRAWGSISADVYRWAVKRRDWPMR